MRVRSYTDVQQSIRLAKILSPESADFSYNNASIRGVNYVDKFRIEPTPFTEADKILSSLKVNPFFEVIPCWSTQALLDEIPYQVVNAVEEDLILHIEKEELQYHLRYENECTGASYEIETDTYDDLVDACFEMILKLKEREINEDN